MITNAEAMASKWHLDKDVISSNNITVFQASPTILGVSGYIEFQGRYHFAYDFGHFDNFDDFQYDRNVTRTENVQANDAINERWMRATNLLSMESARQLALNSMKVIGVSGDFNNRTRSHQLKYEWKDGKNYPLPYYGFDLGDDKDSLRIEVSGIISNVTYLSAIGKYTVRLKPPPNYFNLLGLPPKPIFIKKVSTKNPEYEVILDTAKWHQP